VDNNLLVVVVVVAIQLSPKLMRFRDSIPLKHSVLPHRISSGEVNLGVVGFGFLHGAHAQKGAREGVRMGQGDRQGQRGHVHLVLLAKAARVQACFNSSEAGCQAAAVGFP